MGGEGPAIRFVRDGAITWAARTIVQYLDESERFAAYDRAKPFLLSKRDELLALEGWSEDRAPEGMTNIDLLFCLSFRGKKTFVIPSSITSFLDPSHSEIWESNFRDSRIMTGKRPYRGSTDLFIEGPLPVSDIFYLLQVLVPGMLLIYRVEDINDYGEEEFRRYLPRAKWIEEHEPILLEILGDSRHLSQLKDAATNNKVSFETELITSYRGYDYDSEPDFTACGLECGYCGQWDY